MVRGVKRLSSDSKKGPDPTWKPSFVVFEKWEFYNLLSPRHAYIPMDGIFRTCFFRREVEFFKNQAICLRKLFQPFSNSHFKCICCNVIKDSSSGFILICSDIWTRSIAMILAPSQFFLPHIFMHFTASNSSIGSIGSGIFRNSPCTA